MVATAKPSAARAGLGQATTVGVAVVGCGYWGPNIVRNFFDAPHCRVISVCDAAPSRLDAMSRRHPGIITTDTIADVLRDPLVDAVAIATPARTHAELASQALLAGKHVLVEKPMAMSVGEAEPLVELADRLGLTLMVDHTFVYTGAVRKIKQLIGSGKLGSLYYYDSVRVNLGLVQHDVSVMWDLASHDLSIMDYLLAEEPRAISAVGATHLAGGVADIAYLTVQFANNLIAHFHVNWLSPVKVRQVLIGGERRMVLYDDIEPTEKVKLYDRGLDLAGRTEDAAVRVAYRLGDMTAPALDQTEALLTECSHFVHCIRTGRKPLTDGISGLRVVRLLEAAERSTRNGGRLEPCS